MRSLSRALPVRLACACVVASSFALGLVGCGGDSGPAANSGALPPEATQANKNMEDFMKNPPKK